MDVSKRPRFLSQAPAVGRPGEHSKELSIPCCDSTNAYMQLMVTTRSLYQYTSCTYEDVYREISDTVQN